MVDAPIPLDHLQRPPGWYLFEYEAGAERRAGELIAGDEPAQVHWRLDPSRKRQVLLLERAARGAYVDSAEAAQAARLSRIGRPGALLHMLFDGSGPMEALRRSCVFAANLLLRGLRGATTRLYATHRGAFAPGRPPTTWRLRERLLQARPRWLRARPAHHLAGGPRDEWLATGSDPYFFLEPEDGTHRVLRGGWYSFTGTLKPDRPGAYLEPAFYYAIAGRPQPLPLMMPLPEPRRDGSMSALVRFDGDIGELRFDPSVKPLGFRMERMALRRLSRAEWMLRLLLGLRNASGARDWRLACAVAGRMAAAWRHGGGVAAGAVLAESYGEASRKHSRSYDAWVGRYDTFSRRDLAALAREGAALAERGPLFSVLLPVYDTPEKWLRSCIESVLAQAYPKWELCIADDASTQPHVAKVLHEYARRDPRIRVEFRERNGHIAAASNTALAMARGDYIALLDHDDELRPHALMAMAEEILADPGAALLYSDEDKIDEQGRRFQPYFKPDWNPDLLLSQNYLCHFTVIRTALAVEAGGFVEGTEGSQDHDLFLRCTARLADGGIRHVPRVLYHWRAIAGSTALARGAKDYAAVAGLEAVRSHLAATSPGARAVALEHGHYRVHWPIPDPAPRVDIVIPTRDRLELLRPCVESVLANTRYPDFRLLVVDNGSTDPAACRYLESLAGRARVEVLRHDVPFNFSEINNWAVARGDGEIVCLLNNDIEAFDAGWLEEMVGQALRPGVGAVGGLLLYPDDTIQHAGVVLGLGGVANHAYCHLPAGSPGHGARGLVAQSMSAVTAACLVVQRKHYEAVGGLDERLQVAFNDVDFCLRLRERGLRNVWTPFARLYHHESASRGAEDSPEKVERFRGEVALMRQRWADVLDNDPAYNPNLSLEVEATASQLAFPPREPRRPGRGTGAGAGSR